MKLSTSIIPFVGCLVLAKMCVYHSPRDPERLPKYPGPENWFLWVAEDQPVRQKEPVSQRFNQHLL